MINAAAALLLSMAAYAGSYVDKVNPFVDSHRSRWFFFNSASRPFGMVSLNSNRNMYIQKAFLNGQKWDKCIFPHEEFAKGGTLILDMGPKPNKKWGSDTF